MLDTNSQHETTSQLEQINTALNSGMFIHVRKMLHDMPACDVALLLESNPNSVRTVIWQLIDPDFHGDILEELSEDVRNSIIKQMVPEKLADAMEEMDTDDIGEILRSLPETIVDEVLNSMDNQDRHRAEQSLSYPEDSAGSIMNTDTVTLRPDVTVDVILRYFRLKGELPKDTDTFYVVNKQDVFIGVLNVTSILTAPPDETVSEIMESEPETIPVDLPETEVANLFERHNWISAPVVDPKGRLLGRITIDDVVDIIRENAEHSMMSMAGLDDEEDTFAPVVKSTQRRSIWLAVNLVTALLAAMVSDLFEEVLSQMAVLAILNTIVPSMGGVAGNQTLTLVIRGMALGHISKSNTRWLVKKELAVGFLNGMVWAILIAAVVAIWKQNLILGGVIAIAMMVNLVVAGLSGVLLPIIMKKLKIDPALAGGVILTTITDVVGIFVFLGTASLLLF